MQFVKYHLNGAPGIQMQFNRVNSPNGGPAFYLSATTVPLKLGVLLAKGVEGNGGPLSGASSIRGPVSWQVSGGNYFRRGVWMVPDSINGELYKASNEQNPPTEDSPMNGLSGRDALRLAQAAGCSLPTLAQWTAVLASAREPLPMAASASDGYFYLRRTQMGSANRRATALPPSGLHRRGTDLTRALSAR